MTTRCLPLPAAPVQDAGLVFESVIEADPDAVESWSALGVCMSQLGKLEAALACQRQVLRLRAPETLDDLIVESARDDPTTDAG